MKKGFTLIELLIVIAIIGILSSIVLANLSQARAKGRDAQRKVELRSLQNALELYYADHNIYPPSAQAANYSYCAEPNLGNGHSLPELLVPQYIAKIPNTPPGCTAYLGDQSAAGSSWYRLYTALEKPTSADLLTISSGDSSDIWMGQYYGMNFKFYQTH